jgi:hypothetical protein
MLRKGYLFNNCCHSYESQFFIHSAQAVANVTRCTQLLGAGVSSTVRLLSCTIRGNLFDENFEHGPCKVIASNPRPKLDP